MIKIDKTLFVGKGNDRECFIHPLDSRKCLKITVSGDYKQSNDEVKIFSMFDSEHFDWTHLSRFYGVENTDEGEAVIFELVRDFDDQVSRSLQYYLGGNFDKDVLASALKVLYQYLIENRIIVRDLKSDNILIKRVGGGAVRAILVDGLGNNEFFPLSSYIGFLGEAKIKRKWAKFAKKIQVGFGVSI